MFVMPSGVSLGTGVRYVLRCLQVSPYATSILYVFRCLQVSPYLTGVRYVLPCLQVFPYVTGVRYVLRCLQEPLPAGQSGRGLVGDCEGHFWSRQEPQLQRQA